MPSRSNSREIRRTAHNSRVVAIINVEASVVAAIEEAEAGVVVVEVAEDAAHEEHSEFKAIECMTNDKPPLLSAALGMTPGLCYGRRSLQSMHSRRLRISRFHYPQSRNISKQNDHTSLFFERRQHELATKKWKHYIQSLLVINFRVLVYL
jgi:hypothetical protein